MEPPPAGTEVEYGPTVLLFEPTQGQALDAEAFGRLALRVYAGRMAPDTRLRRTQGGLRLGSMAMDLLLSRLGDEEDVELRIELAQAPPWWAFWRRRVTHPTLSDRGPAFDTPPHDEASLIAELMNHAIRRPHDINRIHDDDLQRNRKRGWDTRSSNDASEYRGRGGEGGGAGASGAWTDAASSGRGPGVDAAGRIAAAAGIAGSAAVAAAAVMSARDRTDHEAASAGVDASSPTEASWSDTDDADNPTTSSADDTDDDSWSSSDTTY